MKATLPVNGSPCRAVQNQIPKQVRDDSVWLLRKRPIPSFRQSSWSESRCYCFMAFPGERKTIQRPTSSFALSTLRPPTPRQRSSKVQIPKQVRDDPEQRPQTEALNKSISGQAHWGRLQDRLSGITSNGYCEKARCRHSDKAPGRNLDAIASRF